MDERRRRRRLQKARKKRKQKLILFSTVACLLLGTAVLVVSCRTTESALDNDRPKSVPEAANVTQNAVNKDTEGQGENSTSAMNPVSATSPLTSPVEEGDNQDAEGQNTNVVSPAVFPEVVGGNYTVNGRELPIYCVETEEKKVALSFNAAWGNEDINQILDILRKYNLKVTFFMTGGWVSDFPEDVKALLAEGHELGNHGENHKNMSQLSDAEIKEEVMAVHNRVKELTGFDMRLFRPPSGDYDSEVITNAKECGYYTIQWDVDSLDWKNYGVDSIIDTVCNHKSLGNGSIILCHNGTQYTALALESIIIGIQEKGYEIVPISELIMKENFHLNAIGRQIKDS